MTDATPARTKVVLLQDRSGQVKRVRVDGVEFGVMHAGPVVVAGQTGMGVALTIADADVGVEMQAEAARPDAAP